MKALCVHIYKEKKINGAEKLIAKGKRECPAVKSQPYPTPLPSIKTLLDPCTLEKQPSLTF